MERLRFHKPNVSADWLRFTALEFCYWFAMAIGAYQTVYLQAKGFTATSIGLINAVLSTLTIFVTPMWGMISDRVRSIKKIYMLGLVAGSIAFSFIPMIAGIPGIPLLPLLLYLCLVFAFRNPANSMLDNWLVRYSNEKALNYGSIRCFGSFSYALAGVIIAPIIASGDTGWTFPCCSAALSVSLFVALKTQDCVPPRRSADKNEAVSVNPMELFRDFRYTSFLLFAFLVFIVCNGICVFMPYLLTSVGEAGSRYGLVSSYTALLEIPMLLLAQPLRKRFPLWTLCLGSAVCFMADGLLLGILGKSFTLILVFETFFGLANGLIIASAANYIYTLTPDHLKATGQSFYIAATCLGAIVGNLGGGMLIDMIGVQPLYTILGIIGAFSALFLAGSIMFTSRMPKDDA